ncbi:hypothetical protein AAFP35_04245 [Gordonia sp. CPCC 206044]|uniref:hypothetical protein n=1 Tax=Gordonia sp. CPCC 206044 TaxID=3140793 RepID=UPI003AF3EAE7
MAKPSKRGRHRHMPVNDRPSPVLMSVTSAALAASIATGLGAGLAQAAPEQGGTSPSDTAPQQGGTTPTPSPGTPEQGGTTPTPPVSTPGPGRIPGPPQEAPYQPYVEQGSYSAPSYDNAYNAVPNAPLSAPKPTAPVRPIAPPPKKIRVGNFITDIPQGMSTKDVNSVNAWSAYGEAKIAQGLISVGVPQDEASRQAASTIIGVMSGGAAGAAALGIPAAAVGALGGAVVGTAVGAVAGTVNNLILFGYVPPMILLGTAAGAGIGLAAGTAIGAAGVGAAGAAVGAVIGGVAGGSLAYALGAGDPGAKPKEPWKQGQPRPKAKPLPNPGANQYELHFSKEKARQAGLPQVDYVVNHRGDVNLQIGTFKTGWSFEQADAPYRALGAGGAQQKDNARKSTKQNEPNIKQALPGADIAWPQEVAPA